MNAPTFNELGVVPYAPDRWRATFRGGDEPVTVYFADEPEHRALETIALIAEADSYCVTPPTRVAEGG